MELLLIALQRQGFAVQPAKQAALLVFAFQYFEFQWAAFLPDCLILLALSPNKTNTVLVEPGKLILNNWLGINFVHYFRMFVIHEQLRLMNVK